MRHEFENLKYNAADPRLKYIAEPDFQAITERINTIKRLFGENNKVAVMICDKGRHTGILYGIPTTANTFERITTTVFTLENDKINRQLVFG